MIAATRYEMSAKMVGSRPRCCSTSHAAIIAANERIMIERWGRSDMESQLSQGWVSRMQSVRFVLAVVTLLVVMVAGCAGRQDDFYSASPNDEAYAPPELDVSSDRVSKGSLYTGTTSLTLFQDRRAYVPCGQIF
ncbi:hypothetical protein OH492_12770 [Vibrio chagasii]|nr:hypothetical protein [Vibrio chagasii]